MVPIDLYSRANGLRTSTTYENAIRSHIKAEQTTQKKPFRIQAMANNQAQTNHKNIENAQWRRSLHW